MVSWCSWLSRQSNTLKVSGSSPGDAIFVTISSCSHGLVIFGSFSLIVFFIFTISLIKKKGEGTLHTHSYTCLFNVKKKKKEASMY